MPTKVPALPPRSETAPAAIPKIIPRAAGVTLPDAGATNGRSPAEVADGVKRADPVELVRAFASIDAPTG